MKIFVNWGKYNNQIMTLLHTFSRESHKILGNERIKYMEIDVVGNAGIFEVKFQD